MVIPEEAIAGLGERLAVSPPAVPDWDRELHFFDGGERTVNYLLLLDALNFSFWGDPETRWQVEFHGRSLSGYGALAGALTRAFEQGIPLWDAAVMADLDEATLREVLSGSGEVPLLAERLAVVRETGRVLTGRYRGWFTTALEQAAGSAVALVRLVVQDFPSFRDEAQYRGRTVRFYKRAQILCADLAGCFADESWGRFTDLDHLTIFADYKLPQVLRELGVLVYQPELSAAVDQLRTLAPGSEQEVELRAATIWSCELLRQDLAGRGLALPAYRLDWYLWDLSQQLPMVHPHHRTRSIYY